MASNIFITATRRNEGKTTITLGLTSEIKKRRPNIGFIKPLGGRDIERMDFQLDEDALLITKVCNIHCNLQDTSPITLRRGLPKKATTAEEREKLREQVMASYERVSADKDFVIIEGSGHAAVGSIYGLSCAYLAQLMNAKVILVTTDQAGHPLDEVILNKVFYESHGVELLGVVVNRVDPPKMASIARSAREILEAQGISLLGVVPDNPVLRTPTLLQIHEAVGGTVVCGRENLTSRHERIHIGAMGPTAALSWLDRTGDERILLITPGDRADLLLATLMAHAEKARRGIQLLTGYVLTGGRTPEKSIMGFLEDSGLPVIVVKDNSYAAASRIHDLVVTIPPNDRRQHALINRLVSKYVDVETILERIG